MRRRGSVMAALLASSVLVACGASVAEANARCTLTFALSESPPLSAVQFTVDYSRVQGSFVGSGAEVECASLVTNAATSVVDLCDGDYAQCEWGEGRLLKAAVIANAGFKGPARLMRCTFEAAEAPEVLDFTVQVDGASLARSSRSYGESESLLDIVSIECGATAGRGER